MTVDAIVEKWSVFSRPFNDETWAEITDSVNALYATMGWDPPMIIPCTGPMQQVSFPALVELMLRLGEDTAKSRNFSPVPHQLREVREVWKGFWDEVLEYIDWDRAVPDQGCGPPLLKRLTRLILTRIKPQFQSQVDEYLGMEQQARHERTFDQRLQDRLADATAALTMDTEERIGFWTGFMGRLPDDFNALMRREYSAEDTPGPILKRGPAQNLWAGYSDWHWLASVHYARDELGCKLSDDLNEQLDLWLSLVFNATSYLFCEHVCFVYLKPLEAHFDGRMRLHNDRKAAVDFVDGTKYYFAHGIEVPEEIIRDRRKLKLGMILDEPNIERRRVLLELYGLENFIRLSGAKKIHEDKYGALYAKSVPPDEVIVVVRVTNSTPEPDGTYKEYFLRVPPTTRTAKAGVAWCFGLDELHYNPDVET